HSLCNFLVNIPRGIVFLTSIETFNILKIADKFYRMLDEIVKKVEVENVVQVVTDNATNYKTAGDLLMKKLKVHNVTIAKVRRITTYIYSRTLLIYMLTHFTKRRDLIKLAVTHFAIAYLTLRCLSEHKPILKIMDERWECQLHRPFHSIAYYLNPHYHYNPNFLVNADIKIGLYNCMERMISNSNERCKIDMQLEYFKDVKGLFGIEATKLATDKKAPARWWDSHGDECPENCLHQKKMSDLVFAMLNLKLKDRKIKRIDEPYSFEDLSIDDEYTTEEACPIDSFNKDWLAILDNANGGHKSEGDEEVPIREYLESHESGYDIDIHDNDEIEQPFNTSRDMELNNNHDDNACGSTNDNVHGNEFEGNGGDEDDCNDDEDGISYGLDADLNQNVDDFF
ncbi:hypothetical protein P3X46_034149, partial [Hevea brasiliensis]